MWLALDIIVTLCTEKNASAFERSFQLKTFQKKQVDVGMKFGLASLTGSWLYLFAVYRFHRKPSILFHYLNGILSLFRSFLLVANLSVPLFDSFLFCIIQHVL